MFQLECCGFNDSSDYTSASMWNKTAADKIPPGCCKNMSDSEECVKSPTTDNSYTQVTMICLMTFIEANTQLV